MTRFAFVEAEKARYPVAALRWLLHVSRAGYDAWTHRPASARTVADEVLTVQIETISTANRKVFGAPRIHAGLTDAGVHVGRERVAGLIRQAEIIGCHRRTRSCSRSPGRTRLPRQPRTGEATT